MSRHLSEEEFVQCIAGQAVGAELGHVAQCPECAAELERFHNAIASFRNAVRGRTETRVASHAPRVTPPVRAPAGGAAKWGWALGAAAAAIFLMTPFFTSDKRAPEPVEDASTEMDPDALMEAVNLHLSRVVPAPMEPMMALLPNNEPTSLSEGVQ
jgi:hypothetical protein